MKTIRAGIVIVLGMTLTACAGMTPEQEIVWQAADQCKAVTSDVRLGAVCPDGRWFGWGRSGAHYGRWRECMIKNGATKAPADYSVPPVECRGADDRY